MPEGMLRVPISKGTMEMHVAMLQNKNLLSDCILLFPFHLPGKVSFSLEEDFHEQFPSCLFMECTKILAQFFPHPKDRKGISEAHYTRDNFRYAF